MNSLCLEKPIGVNGMANVYEPTPYTAKYLTDLKRRILYRIWELNKKHGEPDHMRKWERLCRLHDAVYEKLAPLVPIEYGW